MNTDDLAEKARLLAKNNLEKKRHLFCRRHRGLIKSCAEGVVGIRSIFFATLFDNFLVLLQNRYLKYFCSNPLFYFSIFLSAGHSKHFRFNLIYFQFQTSLDFSQDRELQHSYSKPTWSIFQSIN